MVFPPQSPIAGDFDRPIPFRGHWATPHPPIPFNKFRLQINHK